MPNFAVIGVGGYVAPRHLRAIRETGNTLIAAADPSDSVGVLDSFSLGVRYFREIERFDRHLDKLRRGPESGRVHWVSICSPNYLHDAHIRLALRNSADVICEKPLVLNPWNLDALSEVERETGHRITTVLQLRVHPALLKLKSAIDGSAARSSHEIVLTYITSRGPWYAVSWKGVEERSGGIGTNIGIHFFDMLMWLFGPAGSCEVHLREDAQMSGFIELSNANVRWFLSVRGADLPGEVRAAGRSTFRSITVDGNEIDFTDGFTDLHTRVYEETLAGGGHGIADARPSIELAHRLRTSALGGDGPRHSMAARA